MRLVVDLNDEVYNNMVVKNEYTDRDIIAVHNALMVAKRNGQEEKMDNKTTVQLFLVCLVAMACPILLPKVIRDLTKEED